MTSPPTVSGTQHEVPGSGAHTGQDSRAGRAPFSRCVRPVRTARQERGSAPRRVTERDQGGCRGSEAGSHPVRYKGLDYSHSIVAGGLLVTSSTTRLISGTSLVTRVEIRASTSSGSRAQSAVIASSLVTGRSTTGWP
jgi:hypothetical protein